MAKTKRRKNTTRRTKTPPLPTPAAGEKLWLVHLPFGMRHPAATYRKDLKRHLVVADKLPDELAPYAALPYSYEAWVQDQLNHQTHPTLHATAAKKTPREDQVADARTIVEACAAGWRGFWVGSGVGTGKTITCILAAKAICHLRGGDTVVVTVDRPAAMTIAAWRASIAAVGDGGLRWIIVSSDGGLKQLMATNGQPRINPTCLITDEAQQFRRDSQRTARMRRLARLDKAPGKDVPFTIAVTATPGHTPAEYRYLSSLLAQVRGESPARWADLGQRLADDGFPLEQSYGNWVWDAEAKAKASVRDAATARVRDWMLNATPPVMLNRQPAWGIAQLDGLPVDLTPAQRQQYLLEWGDFQREMHLARRGNDQARGLAALTRFRQKASLIRVDSTVERVVNDLDNGYQVLVSVEHVTTGATPLAEALEAKGIPVAHLYGSRPDMEDQRLAFQHGQAKVAILTISSSVSLHANEHLPDGSQATSAPRRGYFHQARYSGLAANQIMGRAHRDHQTCEWALLYATNTVEEQAAGRMVERLSTLATSVDADRSSLESIAALFGADWLPAATALEEN